jgi:hypothetical protein
VTQYRTVLQFTEGGPAVTGEWEDDDVARATYKAWIGLYTRNPPPSSSWSPRRRTAPGGCCAGGPSTGRPSPRCVSPPEFLAASARRLPDRKRLANCSNAPFTLKGDVLPDPRKVHPT